jgi:hypothetical protein
MLNFLTGIKMALLQLQRSLKVTGWSTSFYGYATKFQKVVLAKFGRWSGLNLVLQS